MGALQWHSNEITTTEAGGKCKLSFDAELVALINENKIILA